MRKRKKNIVLKLKHKVGFSQISHKDEVLITFSLPWILDDAERKEYKEFKEYLMSEKKRQLAKSTGGSS